MSKELIIFLLHKICGHSEQMENNIFSWSHATEIHPGEMNDKTDEINESILREEEKKQLLFPKGDISPSSSRPSCTNWLNEHGRMENQRKMTRGWILEESGSETGCEAAVPNQWAHDEPVTLIMWQV